MRERRREKREGDGGRHSERGSKEEEGDGEKLLTGYSAKVQVVSDDLLVVVVHRTFREAQVEVVAQILVHHAS